RRWLEPATVLEGQVVSLCPYGQPTRCQRRAGHPARTAAPLVVVIPLPDALQRSQCSSPVRKEMMFQAGTFQEVPTWWDLPFPVKITGKVLFGSRWYYAF